MQDLKPLRVFLEVAAQESFVRAAKALNMTPATVTRIVAKLEEELDRQLLLRTTRHVSLTSYGALVAARYRPVVEAFDQVGEELTQDTQPFRGRLSINVPMSFGLRLMPGLIQSFRLAYPNIDLVVRMTDRLVDVMAEECDLAVRISNPPEDKSTIWRKVCEIPRKVVASKAFLDRTTRPEHPDQLDRNFCLSYGHDVEPESWPLHKAGMKNTFTAGTALVSNNGDVLLTMIQRDAGIVLLPEFIAADALKSETIEEVLPGWAVSSLWLSLYYPPYTTLPPLVEAFTDFFEAYLADIDGFNFEET
ncbi:LysR family transcriptional regulator (plasmid) [Roseobacter denitrificans]|uniref:Transcription regulator, LysR family, putative n=1 Tax=Roseobacter denitrificans (strain ATCC 33942 / OCh 114) TaxID=375451 RepID=Q07GK2_ROSDO|nr:LysR family transcriptional regulator [Roseobacter denitrificans]ABI93397.1 transcription regulator, LysR family, putative [Roseobacter denitrificans OCh 114]AVL51241.1 LysR family transcriptional regulator [Roseobacter denitrificans]